MYGFGLIKGLWITLKNLLIPSRMFTVHQYPDRKASPLDLAKIDNSNVVKYLFSHPVNSMKSMELAKKAHIPWDQVEKAGSVNNDQKPYDLHMKWSGILKKYQKSSSGTVGIHVVFTPEFTLVISL